MKLLQIVPRYGSLRCSRTCHSIPVENSIYSISGIYGLSATQATLRLQAPVNASNLSAVDGKTH